MTTVNEVMTTNPIVAEVPGTRNEVLKIMIKHNLTGLPVVRRNDGALAGMISRVDIFKKPEEEQLAMIMNRCVSVIGPDASVEEAAAMFMDQNVRHLQVVEEGHLVGILTPTNLLEEVERRDIKTPVEDMIRQTCVPIYPESPLAVALTTIKVSGVFALPVLDDTGRLVGIITDRDIFNKTNIDGNLAMAELGIGHDEDEWSWDGLHTVMKLWYEVSKIELPKVPVRDIMIREPVTLFKRSSVSEAARIMRKRDFGQLPVRDSKDKLLAMVYDSDVITVLARK